MRIRRSKQNVQSAASLPMKPEISASQYEYTPGYGLPSYEPPEDPWRDIDEVDREVFNIPVDTELEVRPSEGGSFYVDYVEGTTDWSIPDKHNPNEYAGNWVLISCAGGMDSYYKVADPKDMQEIVLDIFEYHGLFPEDFGTYHVTCDIKLPVEAYGWSIWRTGPDDYELSDVNVECETLNEDAEISNLKIERIK